MGKRKRPVRIADRGADVLRYIDATGKTSAKDAEAAMDEFNAQMDKLTDETAKETAR